VESWVLHPKSENDKSQRRLCRLKEIIHMKDLDQPLAPTNSINNIHYLYENTSKVKKKYQQTLPKDDRECVSKELLLSN
jgi:hypothetical protein